MFTASTPDDDYADLLADLNRLLREGLATIEWTDDDAAPRFQITPRGQAYAAADTPEERLWVVQPPRKWGLRL